MLRHEQHPARQRDALAQRQAMLDTIAGYRFLTPHKIAAEERWQRELDRAAWSHMLGHSTATATRRRLVAAARHHLGAVLIAAGTRLQEGAVAKLEPTSGT